MKLFAILFTVVIFTVASLGIFLYISYNNQYVRLKNQYDAQVSVDKAIHDEMKKVIFGQAKVSEKYSSDFENIYTEIMDARYKEGSGKMMQWITESNPNLDPSLYKQLMNTIESQREKFTNNQKKLISIHKELKDLIGVFPATLFLGGKDVPELKIVTSAETEKVFINGKDDNANPFN